ncbi:hypothetical protein PpBr36_02750 [Pyricularia pennisetigena]|uniref:hypothetical protein n=1 Tax=Pyricularia pennisetigena TaxID=1578925 RepID=UPI00114E488F|nr:hypothetical protein PpBr36_02750 [Pyricularia pennisetigena]TLS30651.1 hypothetical protein PpBr36_02750 [Pyricularia pennisetigena]
MNLILRTEGTTHRNRLNGSVLLAFLWTPALHHQRALSKFSVHAAKHGRRFFRGKLYLAGSESLYLQAPAVPKVPHRRPPHNRGRWRKGRTLRYSWEH